MDLSSFGRFFGDLTRFVMGPAGSPGLRRGGLFGGSALRIVDTAGEALPTPATLADDGDRADGIEGKAETYGRAHGEVGDLRRTLAELYAAHGELGGLRRNLSNDEHHASFTIVDARSVRLGSFPHDADDADGAGLVDAPLFGWVRFRFTDDANDGGFLMVRARSVRLGSFPRTR